MADTEDRLVQRARALREAFDVLWPTVLAAAGLVMLAAFVLVPSLRSPPLIVALSGMYTVITTIGLVRRESR